MDMANEQEFDFSISEIQFNSTQTDSFFQNLSSNNNSEDSCTSLNYNDKKKRSVGGGITCCVPHCFNNSKKNKELFFYVIPKEKNLRKLWLSKISRKNFTPSTSHRVCSEHFVGGKKTYMNNVPTVVPKTIKITERKARETRNSLGLIPEIALPTTADDVSEGNETNEERLANEVSLLKAKLEDLEIQKQDQEVKLKNEISHIKYLLEKSQFTVDRFRHNKEHFKFYTGFESYELFKFLLTYLEPEVNNLLYWGSITKEQTNQEDQESSLKKRGQSRTLTVEEEFFMVLTRLRCAFPLEDLGVRFNMSTSNVSRILITWYDCLHIQLRALPIWATKQTVTETMPKCFKDLYPKTRVKHCGILDLLEAGDDLMADRGFDIEEELPKGVTLNIPPFLNGKKQLTLEKELETRRIASVRVHVERAIERIKNYKILQTVFQLSMAADFNKIWVICCYLVNFLSPLIAEKSE